MRWCVKKFYGAMGVSILGLFGTATFYSLQNISLENESRLRRYETLPRAECVERFWSVSRDMRVAPKNATEYYNVLGRAYALIGSAQKSMSLEQGFDRNFDIIREIPVRVHQDIFDYGRRLEPFLGTPAQETALREFEDSGQS